MTTRRAAYSKFKRHLKSKYRSGLEESINEELRAHSIDGLYEQHYLTYTIPASEHRYTPDFILPNGIIIESKGLWDAEDRKKHLLIKEQYPQLDIRFVFSRSKTPIYKGSKTTYASFCDANGFLYSDKRIPENWLKEPKKVIPKGILVKNNKKNNKTKK